MRSVTLFSPSLFSSGWTLWTVTVWLPAKHAKRHEKKEFKIPLFLYLLSKILPGNGRKQNYKPQNTNYKSQT